MKGLFFGDHKLTPDQAFILRRCSHNISTLRRQCLFSRIMLAAGFLLLLLFSENDFWIHLFKTPIQLPQIIFPLAVIFILFNPFKFKQGKLDCHSANMFLVRFSLQRYHDDLYQELIHERTLLEGTGMVLSEQDWEKRIQLAFDECKFGMETKLPVKEASDAKVSPAARLIGN